MKERTSPGLAFLTTGMEEGRPGGGRACWKTESAAPELCGGAQLRWKLKRDEIHWTLLRGKTLWKLEALSTLTVHLLSD